MKPLALFIAAWLSIQAIARDGHAQSQPLKFKQPRDLAPCVAMTPAELAELDDPFFRLVLKDKANLTKLQEIVDALQANSTQRQLFVVNESIVSNDKTGSRRAVIAFKGTSGGELLEQNVMLSAFFGSNGFGGVVTLEAWGWDNAHGRYNYYKLDTTGNGGTGIPAGTVFWKFRSTSKGAERLTIAQRQGTCLQCHVSGAPIMKELFFPWNNWHAGVGGTTVAQYLVATSPRPPTEWNAATTALFKSLAAANVLEDDQLLAPLRRFAKSRLLDATKVDAMGQPVVTGGKRRIAAGRRLLKPLLETTDVNLYSSRQRSGSHPPAPAGGFVPAAPIGFPRDQFFLNTSLIAGGGEGDLTGLEIAEARQFDFATLTQQENKNLLTAHGVKLFNKAGGDTEFALFVPGTAYVDNALASECLEQGAITPQFLAAALAVDLENPVFSAKRASLLALVPDEYDYDPIATFDVNAAPDPANDLVKKTIAKIDAAAPATGSAADEFRTLLKSANAVAELKTRVIAYVARMKGRLAATPANAANRKTELDRLFRLILDRRKAMMDHPELSNLNEADGELLPVP